MEREKGRERIRATCEYERESCPKIVKKWLYKYHFSLLNGCKETPSVHNSTVGVGFLLCIASKFQLTIFNKYLNR